MAIEIERRFLVDKNKWKNEIPEKSLKIKQGYFLIDKTKTIRVRIQDDCGFITFKGAAKIDGFAKSEFEYSIPLADALFMMENLVDSFIDKTRHIIYFNNMKWEVDEFHEQHSGLFLAEIELNSESQKIELPGWVSDEVTFNYKYSNAWLSQNNLN
jgi:CYTH domain-containing protein